MTIRAKLGFVFIIIFSLSQSFRALGYYNPVIAREKFQKGDLAPSDSVTIYKKNLSCLLDDLTPGKVIGFVTSVPDKRQQQQAAFHMTQYAIVPFLLEDSVDHEQVIAYYPLKIKPRPEFPEGFQVVKQCTDEVFLLERSGQ